MPITHKDIVGLKKVLEDKVPVFLKGDNVDIHFKTNLIEVKNNNLIIKNIIEKEYITKFMQSKKFSLQSTMRIFTANKIESTGVDLIFSIENDSSFEETRSTKRRVVSDNDKYTCLILNPFDNRTVLEKEIIDISDLGISCSTNFNSKLFQRDVILPSCKIMLKGKEVANKKGLIVYTRKLFSSVKKLQIQVGIKFDK